jgi:hypothetical protein
LRKQLEIEKGLLLDEVFPQVLAISAPKQMTATASGGSVIVLEGKNVVATSHQTINDADAISALVGEIFDHRRGLRLPSGELTKLEGAIQSVGEELRAGQPKTSVLREGLNTVRTILEGAAGSGLATAIHGNWSQILLALSQLLHLQ